jgi:hypothetical protein
MTYSVLIAFATEWFIECGAPAGAHDGFVFAWIIRRLGGWGECRPGDRRRDLCLVLL